MGRKQNKKKDDRPTVRAWVQSFGMLLVLNPAVARTWSGGSGGTADKKYAFTHYEFNTKGKIRIPTFLSTLGGKGVLDSVVKVPNSDLSETVVFDFEYKHSASPMELDFSPKLEFQFDFSETQVLNHFTQRLGELIKSEMFWDTYRSVNLDFEKRSRGDLTAFEKSSYIISYGIVIVDNLQKFYNQLSGMSKEIMGQRVAYMLKLPNFIEIRLSTPIREIPPPYLEIQRSPLIIYAVGTDNTIHNNKQIPVEMMNQILEGLTAARTQRDHLIHINRMHLIHRSNESVSANCTDILEGLPRISIDSESGREERIRNYIQAWEQFSIYKSTYLLSRDFVLREESIEVPTGYYNPKFVKSKIEQSLDILDKRIDLLGETIQTQLSFDQEEKRFKSERRFSLVSIVLATLVIFEVFASYLSWSYPQGSLIGGIAWIVLMTSMVFFIIWAIINVGLKMTIREVISSGSQNDIVETKKSITSTVLSCPYCDATYSYDSTMLELTCQNCDKVFKKDGSIL
ncbi:MAG: hypothetical protein ACW98Y_09500 [Candidatus Thorarchaeota archaeon]